MCVNVRCPARLRCIDLYMVMRNIMMSNTSIPAHAAAKPRWGSWFSSRTQESEQTYVGHYWEQWDRTRIWLRKDAPRLGRRWDTSDSSPTTTMLRFRSGYNCPLWVIACQFVIRRSLRKAAHRAECDNCCCYGQHKEQCPPISTVECVCPYNEKNWRSYKFLCQESLFQNIQPTSVWITTAKYWWKDERDGQLVIASCQM